MKKVLTTCPYCGTGCMYYLVVGDNDTLLGVEPSSEHVVAKGQLCVKGWNAYHFVNHPDRLKQPLIRRNGKMEPASWDEALDLVVEKLKDTQANYGNDSVAFFSSAKTTFEIILPRDLASETSLQVLGSISRQSFLPYPLLSSRSPEDNQISRRTSDTSPSLGGVPKEISS